jgi:hypothetical protein
VHVGERRRRREDCPLRVVQLDSQRDDRVLRYERSRLTRSNTSAACPRGVTP